MRLTREARTGTSSPLEGMVALIVDAKKINRRLIGKLLREHGCDKIHETADVRDADDLLGITLGNLDIALINADLPKIQGAGLVKMLRAGKARGDRALPCLLYHPLADDPSEANDLAATQVERVAEMQKRLNEIAAADNDAKVESSGAKSE